MVLFITAIHNRPLFNFFHGVAGPILIVFVALIFSGTGRCASTSIKMHNAKRVPRHAIAWNEPGAQGEHKISRGFAPTVTYSAHWLLRDARFDRAIARHLDDERRHMRYHIKALSTHLPYKSGQAAATT